MNLDPKTVIIFNSIGSLFISLGFYIISRGHLGKIWEIRQWAFSSLIQAIGWILVGVLRGKIPEIISVIVGNGFIIFSQAITFNILCRFETIKVNRYYSYVITIFTIVILGYYYLIFPDTPKRIIFLSIGISIIQIASSVILIISKNRSGIYYFLSSIYAVCGITLSIRAFAYSFYYNPNSSLFEQNFLQDINFLVFFLTVMLLPLGFLLLCIDQFIKKKEIADEKIKMLNMGIEQSPVLIVITDKNGIIEYVNPSFADITGYAPEEVIGQNPRILKTGYTSSSEYQKIWSEITTGKKWKGIFQNKKKNGELYWESANISPIINEYGDITHYIGIKENITSQLTYEKKIRESEEKYRLILQTSRDLIHILDINGNLIEYNDAFLKHLGYSQEEAKNLNVSNWDVQWTPIELIDLIRKLIDNPMVFETIHKKKDGSFVNVEISTTGIFFKDNYFLYAAARDITNRKKNENALKESQEKLKESNATKDKFFSIIAHDLRGPIGNIGMILEMITDKDQIHTQEERENFLRMLKSSAKNILLLLANLLEWSQAQKGEIEFSPNCYRLNELVCQNIELLLPTANNKHISLENKIPEELICYYDLEMMNTVIRNLISNAIKYTKTNGSVSISAKEESDFIEIKVSDSGIGMKKEISESLFKNDLKQPSIQGTSGEKGSRLGLILCKEFIDKHNGYIAVHSDIGKGSEFKIMLPKK